MKSQYSLCPLGIFTMLCSACSCFLGPGALSATDWDFEYWGSFKSKQYEKEALTLYMTGEFRSRHHCSVIRYYRITENIAWEIFPHLDLELHYSYLTDSLAYRTTIGTQHRLEIELNPSFELSCLSIKLRNRIQLTKHESAARISPIFRQRTMAVFLKNCYENLREMRCHNEIHYDLEGHRVIENVFVPLEVSLGASDGVGFDLFLALRDRRFLSCWHRSIILGSNVEF